LLLDNCYPLHLIFNKINLKLKKLFVHRLETTLGVTNTDIGSNSKRKIIVLPYVNPLSEFIYDKYR